MVLFIGMVWDAINDPLIGIMADRVRTRWGRRRPFFLFGALPFGLSFIMLWWVPPLEATWVKAIYYTFAYILFDTAFTLVAVPYSALTPEMTEDYDERTRLNGYRMSVSVAGGLIAAVLFPLAVTLFPDRKSGYLSIAAIFGILACLPYFLLFVTVKERFQEIDRSSMSLWEGFKTVWRNKPFRYVAGIFMTAWVTVNIVGALFQYFLTYWMMIPNRLEIVLGLVQLSALICVPVVVQLSNRIGKKGAYLVGLTWWVIVMVTLAFIQPNQEVLTYFLAISVGLGIASAHVIPSSMMPDVIEVDELATGLRREGTYYGFLVFIQKVGVAMGLALIQIVLHFTGYQPGAVQNPQTLTAIRVMIGPLPAILLCVSIFLAAKYPITKNKHTEIRNALVEKRAKAL